MGLSKEYQDIEYMAYSGSKNVNVPSDTKGKWKVIKFQQPTVEYMCPFCEFTVRGYAFPKTMKFCMNCGTKLEVE